MTRIEEIKKISIKVWLKLSQRIHAPDFLDISRGNFYTLNILLKELPTKYQVIKRFSDFWCRNIGGNRRNYDDIFHRIDKIKFWKIQTCPFINGGSLEIPPEVPLKLKIFRITQKFKSFSGKVQSSFLWRFCFKYSNVKFTEFWT